MAITIADNPNPPVLDVAEVVALERRIAESSDGPDMLELMLRAGRALAAAAQAMVGEKPCSITILAGHGNNGGDGWAAADLLAQAGHRVNVVCSRGAHEITARPASVVANMLVGRIRAHELDVKLSIMPKASALDALLAGSSLIIDCMLGIGFGSSEVREPYASWITAANGARTSYRAHILAADVPSGLYAQTGLACPTCINADATLTMLAVKPGLQSRIAEDHVGELLLAPLGIDIDEYPA